MSKKEDNKKSDSRRQKPDPLKLSDTAKQRIEEFVASTLEAYKSALDDIKEASPVTIDATSPIRQKINDYIVDTVVKTAATQSFPNFSTVDLRMIRDKLKNETI